MDEDQLEEFSRELKSISAEVINANYREKNILQSIAECDREVAKNLPLLLSRCSDIVPSDNLITLQTNLASLASDLIAERNTLKEKCREEELAYLACNQKVQAVKNEISRLSTECTELENRIAKD